MRHYSLAQIEALAAIARLGSFQAAAEHINVTQPTISLRIRDLEQALGKTFFERDGRSAKLNADGVVATQYAEQLLKLLDEMETRLRTGDPLQGTLRVGSSETIAIAVLPQIISFFGERYPRVKIELTVSNSYVLSEELASNKLDVAFLADPGNPPHIHIEPLATAPVAWMGSRTASVQISMAQPETLADVTILCMPKTSPLHEMMLDWWEKEGGGEPTSSTCNSLAMLARLVSGGVGIGVLPTCILRDEIQKGSVVSYRQRTPFAPLHICAAYPKATRSEGIAALVNIARSVMLESRCFMPLDSEKNR